MSSSIGWITRRQQEIEVVQSTRDKASLSKSARFRRAAWYAVARASETQILSLSSAYTRSGKPVVNKDNRISGRLKCSQARSKIAMKTWPSVSASTILAGTKACSADGEQTMRPELPRPARMLRIKKVNELPSKISIIMTSRRPTRPRLSVTIVSDLMVRSLTTAVVSKAGRSQRRQTAQATKITIPVAPAMMPSQITNASWLCSRRRLQCRARSQL